MSVTSARNGKHAAAPPPSSAVEEILITRVSPSPLNPRKRFDPAALEDLAQTVRAHGILQALVVRPRPGKPGGYEIVAGERRYRAAQIAGLAKVPCRVVELDDRQALELMVVENEQRADVSPVERAAGYAALVNLGVKVEDLAARVGKSPSTVRDCIRLGDAPACIVEALDAGEVSVSTALLVARVPNAELREKVAGHVLLGDFNWSDLTEEDLELVRDPAARRKYNGGTPLTYEDTKDLIARHLCVELKGAPFNRKALDLVEAAGSCDECPKRVGNLQAADPEAWKGARADVCTDPACYRAKVEAHAARLAEAQREKGLEVLAGAEAEKLFESWDPTRLREGAGFVELSEKCHADGQKRTYQKLVGKQLAGEVTVAIDARGNAHKLVPKARAKEVLEAEHGIKERVYESSADDQRWRKEQRERERKAKVNKAAARIANGQAAAAAEKAFAGVVGIPPKAVELLRALVAETADITWSDACRQVEIRRGAEPEGDGRDGRVSRKGMRDLVGAAGSLAELMGLYAELVAARTSLHWGGVYSSGPDKDEKGFWAALGVDPKKCKKEAEEAAKEKASAKAQKGKKGTRKTDRNIPQNMRGANGQAPEGNGATKKNGAAVAEPAAAPRPELERWRDITLTDLQLPKKAERTLRKMKLLSAGQVADWLPRQGGSLGALLLGHVEKAIDRVRYGEQKSRFDFSMRVRSKVTGRAGRITGRMKQPGAITLWFVKWDPKPDQAEGEGAYQSEDQLEPLPEQAPPATDAAWRQTALPLVSELDMPDADRLFEQYSITNLGQLADRFDAGDSCGLKGKVVIRLRQRIEIDRSAGVKVSKADQIAKKNAERKCRVCGCTDADCRQCIAKTGRPCAWVEEDLCSACADEEDAKLGEEMARA